jgi:hypothetical protein
VEELAYGFVLVFLSSDSILYGAGDGLSDVAISRPEVVKLSVPGLRDPTEEA